MKRAFILCLALITSLFAVTGSIAFFTDNIEAYSTVKSGNLHILQHEYERKMADDGSYTLREYTQDQVIYPSAKADGTSAEKVTVGEYVDIAINHDNIRGFVDKIVVAENGGSLNAYVRTFVAVPAYSNGTSNVEWIHLDWNNANGWIVCDKDQVIRNQKIDGVNYDIWYATNTNVLAPNAVTAPSLLGYYIDSQVNHNGTHYTLDGVQLGSSSELKILVATEAAQVTPASFTDAFVALNTTYSKAPGDGRHPWANEKIILVANQTALNNVLTTATYDTQIGLSEGEYTLPATELPAGIRIFATGKNVTITGPADISAKDVEFDGVTFTNAINFTGWGSFEAVVFEQNCTVNFVPDNCNVLFSSCKFNGAYPSAEAIVLSNCTDLNGNVLAATTNTP